MSSLPTFWRNRIILAAFLTAGFLLSAAFFFAARAFAGIEHLLIVRFEAGRGIKELGSVAQVFGFLAAGGATCFLNGILARLLYARGRVFSYVLATSAPLLALLIFVATVVIIEVN